MICDTIGRNVPRGHNYGPGFELRLYETVFLTPTLLIKRKKVLIGMLLRKKRKKFLNTGPSDPNAVDNKKKGFR